MAVRSVITEIFKIVLLCIVFSLAYGIIHDQITVRISPEYFTIGHPAIENIGSPTVLALFWGVVSTWWVGLILGLLLSVASLAGNWPQRNARSLLKPLLTLFAFTAFSAFVFGIIGSTRAESGEIALYGSRAALIAEEQRASYLTALWVHSGSYTAAASGGVVLAAWTAVSRKKRN